MRKFVHLVLKYRHTLNEFSVRNIDTSRFFRPASMPPGPFSFPTEPSDLPPQAISFSPPYLGCGSAVAEMDFMLLGGEHNKLLAVDQEGNSILYDPIGNNTRAMPPLASPKSMSLSLTVGGTDLYAMNQIPSWPPTANPVFHDHDFEGILFDQQQQGYDCCALPPTPCRFKDFSPSHGSILSYVVAGGGSSIWITKHEMGTYSFDTRTRLWSKVGDWSLPILGRGEYVPEHKLWFGLSSSCHHHPSIHDIDTDLLCAVDLEMAQNQKPPVSCASWEHSVPPKEWDWSHVASYLMHLGSAKFCLARFFDSDRPPRQFAVFTGLEVERCVDEEKDQEGGLRMLKHRSEVYLLPSDMVFWVL